MASHPKSVRRRLLQILYHRYLTDPLEMLSPEDLLEDGTVARDALLANAHYLNDRGLIELMFGYRPPYFAAARITANGIDVVENEFEFNLRFPPAPGEKEEAAADIPWLMERLVEEAEFAPLDGEARRCLLRDVQYLREEFARPVLRWRANVIESVLSWIEGHVAGRDAELQSLEPLRQRVRETLTLGE